MKVWTTENPGAGDMSVIETWKASVDGQSEACLKVIEKLRAISSSSTNHWEGKGGVAFVGAIARRIERLDLMSQACAKASAAASEYVGAVEIIREQTAECYARIERARSVIADSEEPVLEGFPSHGPNADHYEEVLQAVDELGLVAYRRHEADQIFMRDVLRQMSGRVRTERSEYETMDRDDRGQATDASKDLFLAFASGQAPRDIGITDGIIPVALADSGHMKNLRERLIRLLKGGDLDVGDQDGSTRSLSSDVLTLSADGSNVITGGRFGNTPETFFGSFEATYEVVKIEGGEATVTFTVTNDTTRQSFNRVPLVPFVEMPWAPGVNIGHDVLGGYEPIGETVVWTEKIEF